MKIDHMQDHGTTDNFCSLLRGFDHLFDKFLTLLFHDCFSLV